MFTHDEDLGFQVSLAYSLCNLDPIESREPDVQQDKIWLQFLSLPDALQSIGHVTDDLQFRLFLKQGKDEVNPGRVIFHHENSNRWSSQDIPPTDQGSEHMRAVKRPVCRCQHFTPRMHCNVVLRLAAANSVAASESRRRSAFAGRPNGLDSPFP